MLVPKGLVGLHRTIHFSFFDISGWGIDLDYYDVAWFALEMNQDRSVIFEIAPKYWIQPLLLTMRPTPFFSKRFLPTVIDIIVT